MSSRATPRLRIEQACERLGRSEVVRRCVRLLAGGPADRQFVVTLGGAHALQLLDGGVPPGQDYWLRVWAARGLLWAGPGDDIAVLRAALADESWRVRELTCKVVARYRVGDLLDDAAALESDPVARVRAAAVRAATRIVEARA
jgi:hypothetical protein